MGLDQPHVILRALARGHNVIYGKPPLVPGVEVLGRGCDANCGWLPGLEPLGRSYNVC